MYDELVKRLKEDKSWVEQGTTQTEHEIAEHIQQAADAIEELMRRCEQFQYMPPPAWIPVTERLPKEEETVLAFGTLGVAWLDWRHDNKWCCYGGVTHWMPLPTQPTAEEYER